MPDTLTPSRPPVAENGISVGGVAGPPPLTDQEQFDAAVNRDSRIVMQILAGVAVLAALVMSTVALVLASAKSTTNAPAPAATAAAVVAPVPSAAVAKPIDLKVIGASKLGPDGKKHDVFTKTEFAVKVGQPLKLRINNTDDVPHSITAPVAGVSLTIKPGTHTYRLIVTQAGRFQWFCIIPCDSDAHGWAMQTSGYMAGYITAT
jgi:plastocyanin